MSTLLGRPSFALVSSRLLLSADCLMLRRSGIERVEELGLRAVGGNSAPRSKRIRETFVAGGSRVQRRYGAGHLEAA
ncbi:hypothetical protein QO002_004533 [Pararhizobium capsulatum DSM 1112]|uniref:Uncharacterized protein n=1 Tax=Pararhizobium capsulatum DSM 1112 TaxID=1121113 RepID=A0ABU0BZQ8_9HYPH|nr:hypothetical protein [Pararhizobium capsulatum DSM 1112]